MLLKITLWTSCMKRMLALYTCIHMCNLQSLKGSHHLQCTMGTHANKGQTMRTFGWAWQDCTSTAVARVHLCTLSQLCLHTACEWVRACVRACVRAWVLLPLSFHTNCTGLLMLFVAQCCGPAYCVLTDFWKHSVWFFAQLCKPVHIAIANSKIHVQFVELLQSAELAIICSLASVV